MSGRQFGGHLLVGKPNRNSTGRDDREEKAPRWETAVDLDLRAASIIDFLFSELMSHPGLFFPNIP